MGEYEIFDGKNFRDFSDIQVQEKELFQIICENGRIKATDDHRFLSIDNEWVYVSDLNTNTILKNAGRFIEKYSVGVDYVYDPINVEISHSYESNGFISHNCAFVYIDEAAFVENWQEFYSSVYPTIASGKDTKLLLTSTVNGLNHFYKFYVEAKENRNGFVWIEVPWDRVPGRDEAWKIETLAGMNHNYEQFEQEFNNVFLGSSGTLITGSVLKSLVHQTPIYEWDGFKQYIAPIKQNSYIMLCDVSRGKGLDYSAFSVIDVTTMPYKQVATFRNNTITPTDYAHVINRIGVLYNTASVLIENNDIGGQVADILFDDLDYENLLFTESNGRSGKVLCGGGSKAEPSIRTTTSVKAKGCSVLKLLIEQQQLIINDFDTINELSRFSKKGKSFEAESDSHDDMVMGLVLFAWCTINPYFTNLTDVNTLHNLRDDSNHWDECVPFGFIVDGSEEEEPIIADGQVWKNTNAWLINY